MELRINMVGIITSQMEEMKAFYRDALGLKIIVDMGGYVEFEHPNVRFALSTHEVMAEATGNKSYSKMRAGQSLELAFRVDGADQVDSSYETLLEKGAKGVMPPHDMPWGQRAAFFADPDGNIHEVFCDLR